MSTHRQRAAAHLAAAPGDRRRDRVQSLAANVDLVLIRCGLDRPVPAGRVHRIAAQAWDAGTEPVLVLTSEVTRGRQASATVELFEQYDFIRIRPVGKHAWAS